MLARCTKRDVYTGHVYRQLERERSVVFMLKVYTLKPIA